MSLDLPMMRCDHGCGKCCGPVVCTESEYQAIAGYSKNRSIEPVRQQQTCPWYQNGACQVYEVRPFMCRLFGHAEGLVCCQGYNVNIPQAREKKLMRDYIRRIGREGERFLHEAAYGQSDRELMDAVLGLRMRLGDLLREEWR